MTKSAILGLASGLTLVLLTLVAVAIVNLPQAAVSGVRSSAQACPLADVAQDQGYGITRTVKKPVCRPESQAAD